MDKILNEFEKTIEEISMLKEVQNAELLEPVHEGKWSIREIVGHLYYWDKHNLEQMVPKMSNGASLPPFPDHDQHNKEAVSYLTKQSVESIIDSFINTRQELIESMLKIDSDIRFTVGKGKRQFSRESFIKIFLKHDAHHIKQINEKLNVDMLN